MTKLSDCWETPQKLFDVLDKGGCYQGIRFSGFHFGIDLCANSENAKCRYFMRDYLNDIMTSVDSRGAEDWLEFIGRGCIETCFMNPPYSNPLPFVKKAWEDSKRVKIVCLLKANTSTKWWATFWDYNSVCPDCDEGVCFYFRFDTTSRDAIDAEMLCDTCEGTMRVDRPKPGCQVIFFPKRIKFTPPTRLDVCRCNGKHRTGYYKGSFRSCKACDKRLMSGPTFPSALLIFDRRDL